MFRATTPTFAYDLPEPPNNFLEIKIVMSQNNNLLVTRTKQELGVEGNMVHFTLTQQEANMFSAGKLAQVQMRALHKSGNVYATDIENVIVQKVLDDSILGGEA